VFTLNAYPEYVRPVPAVVVAAEYTRPLASVASPPLDALVMWRFVVVAFVEEAFVAKSEEKLLYALQKFCVVVPNASEMLLTERTIGYTKERGFS